MNSRRQAFKLLSVTAAYSIPNWLSGEVMDAPELLSGDDDSPGIELRFNPNIVESFTRVRSATAPKDKKQVISNMLEITKAFANQGLSRITNEGAKVSEMLELFDLPLRYKSSDNSSGTYVPYCAAGVSYAACLAYAKTYPTLSIVDDREKRIRTLRSLLPAIREHYFLPSPSVRAIVSDAKLRGSWKSIDIAPETGWLVVFSWSKSRQPNHIGMVDSKEGDILNTLEYNTSTGEGGSQRDGGRVAIRKRDLRFVLGYIATC